MQVGSLPCDVIRFGLRLFIYKFEHMLGVAFKIANLDGILMVYDYVIYYQSGRARGCKVVIKVEQIVNLLMTVIKAGRMFV